MQASPVASPTFVDSHCHIPMLSQGDTPAGVSEVLRVARDNGVSHFLCVAVDLESLPDVLAVARNHPEVFASIGIHPNTDSAQQPSVEELVALSEKPKVVAIGETGLDYYRTQGGLEWQHERFRHHIRAARECGKPLIVHTRDARADTIRLLIEEKAAEVGGVMHCFTEDFDTASRAMDLGFMISFSGIVTFRNAVALQDVAKRVPLERILVETDCPYLAPIPYRGKENQPAYVRHVGEFIAKLKDLPVEEVARQTSRNFFTLFRDAA
ncbi:MAG: TatD family hydrolase [Gammaproteobacteria bacterium]